MVRRFSTLRAVSSILKILAFGLAVITFIIAIAICLAGVAGGVSEGEPSGGYGIEVRFGLIGGVFGGIIFAAMAAIGGGGLAAVLYAFADLILIQIAIEENTRATLRILEAQAIRLHQEQTGQYPYYG